MIKAAVIAGTPVDTQMGVDYINRRNSEAGEILVEPIYMPVSEDCDAQMKFQYLDTEAKLAVLDEIFDKAIEDGIEDFFIYCNSLSGAVDFDSYAEAKGVRCYTPLQVYRSLGKRYSRLGVMAAHNFSAYNIEKELHSVNEDMYVIGAGNMAIVSAIEEGETPVRIAVKLGLSELIYYMEHCGAEAVILGCTHFPYLKDELARYARVPLIDPADEMFGALLWNNEFETRINRG